MISPLLKEFLADWYAWAIADDPNIGRFDTADGLCDSYYLWLIHRGERKGTGNKLKELTDLFKEQGLDDAYPFGFESFEQRSEDHTMHRDPNRLAWVKEMLENN